MCKIVQNIITIHKLGRLLDLMFMCALLSCKQVIY